jgi:WD40 repeat protein
LWSIAERKLLHHLEVPAWARSLGFSPDGKGLVVGDHEKSVTLWDTTTGKKIDELPGHSSGVCCVRFTHDGNTVASSGQDGTVRLWHLDRDKRRDSLEHRPTWVDQLAFSADGKWFATADRQLGVETGHKVVLRDPTTWDTVQEFPGRTFAFSHDRNLLAVGGETEEEGESVAAVHV